MVNGRRLKNAVKKVYAIGLDIDTGTPTAYIIERLKELNCKAVHYSTFNDKKTKHHFPKDDVIKRMKLDGEDDITTDVMRGYCADVKKWHPCVIPTIEFIQIIHINEDGRAGIMAEIETAPMDKNRVIVFLKEPYDMATEAKTQIEATRNFSKLPQMLADYLQVPLVDPACFDPSHLFYLPRRKAESTPYAISVFGGPLFDWRNELRPSTKEDADRYAEAIPGGSKCRSTTEGGKALWRWACKRAHGFQLADAISFLASDKERGPASEGITIECPYDSGHSNAGDPSDSACYVKNADLGKWPVVHCHHASCASYDTLDMFAKMLEDGWLSRDVLTDEDYNSVVLDDEQPQAKKANPESDPDPEKSEEPGEAEQGDAYPKSESEPKQDEEPEYLTAIKKLTPKSREADIEAAILKLLKAKLSITKRADAERILGKQLKLNKAKLTNLLAQVRKESGLNVEKPGKAHKDGKTTFRYEGYFDWEDAADVCKEAVLAANKSAGFPVLSIMDDYPVFLTQKRAAPSLKK
jgi:hypothetical protein